MRYILLLLCCLCFVNCQERRRRIKKKIIVQNEDTTPESQQKDLVTEANQKPKEPRGYDFLNTGCLLLIFFFDSNNFMLNPYECNFYENFRTTCVKLKETFALNIPFKDS